jgi:2-methylisocitrate lyase-like PEP mutase family enzyme
MSHTSPTIARLRERLDPHHPAIAMAAHNPLAAKLAAQAGFDAIWGSGFELSAAYAVPDTGILSVDTHLELMRAIGEVQDAPVIADLDTGYGNAVNVAYLVPRYAAAGVAAVVIEDKTFPKDSSLRPGGRQVLVPIEEFQGKIEPARISDGPLVVARTEALIAGLGQAEALRRGAAYAEAGADAVLIRVLGIGPVMDKPAAVPNPALTSGTDLIPFTRSSGVPIVARDGIEEAAR